LALEKEPISDLKPRKKKEEKRGRRPLQRPSRLLFAEEKRKGEILSSDFDLKKGRGGKRKGCACSGSGVCSDRNEQGSVGRLSYTEYRRGEGKKRREGDRLATMVHLALGRGDGGTNPYRLSANNTPRRGGERKRGKGEERENNNNEEVVNAKEIRQAQREGGGKKRDPRRESSFARHRDTVFSASTR